MLRVLFFIPFLFIACSRDQPVPSAPAGKAQAALEAPAAPTNLRFDTPTDSSCTVRWDASDGATDYDINYRPVVGGRWTNWPHRGASRQHSTIYGLEPNTEYRWAVRAENTDGASAWIHGDNFTTRPSSQEEGSDDAIASPTNLRFDAPTDSSCTVRWDAVDGATDYDVNYKPTQGGRWTNAPHRGVRLHNTIHDLQPNTEYRWAVRAENSDGASAWIHGPNFTTLENPPGPGVSEQPSDEEIAQLEAEFNIELVFHAPEHPFTEKEKQIIREVADFWEEIIVGDLPDYRLTDLDLRNLGGYGWPSIGSTRNVPVDIDDLRMYVRRIPNGGYNITCNGSHLINRYTEGGRAHWPAVGYIYIEHTLDEVGDYWDRNAWGNLQKTRIFWSEDRFRWQVAHEIGHVLLGPPSQNWKELFYYERHRGRLLGVYFTGNNALEVFGAMVDGNIAKGVLIEVFWQVGFPGKFHWKEHDDLKGSLMVTRPQVGFPNDVPLKVSKLTIGALTDLGYQVR